MRWETAKTGFNRVCLHFANVCDSLSSSHSGRNFFPLRFFVFVSFYTLCICIFACPLVSSYRLPHTILLVFYFSSQSYRKKTEKAHEKKLVRVFIHSGIRRSRSKRKRKKNHAKRAMCPNARRRKMRVARQANEDEILWAVSFDAHHTSFDTVCVNWFGCALSHMPVIFRTASKWAKRASLSQYVFVGVGPVVCSVRCSHTHTHTFVYNSFRFSEFSLLFRFHSLYELCGVFVWYVLSSWIAYSRTTRSLELVDDIHFSVQYQFS